MSVVGRGSIEIKIKEREESNLIGGRKEITHNF